MLVKMDKFRVWRGKVWWVRGWDEGDVDGDGGTAAWTGMDDGVRWMDGWMGRWGRSIDDDEMGESRAEANNGPTTPRPRPAASERRRGEGVARWCDVHMRWHGPDNKRG